MAEARRVKYEGDFEGSQFELFIRPLNDSETTTSVQLIEEGAVLCQSNRPDKMLQEFNSPAINLKIKLPKTTSIDNGIEQNSDSFSPKIKPFDLEANGSSSTTTRNCSNELTDKLSKMATNKVRRVRSKPRPTPTPVVKAAVACELSS